MSAAELPSAAGIPFGAPVSLGAVNSPVSELDPSVSADGLTLVFYSNRTPNVGFRMYVSTRTSTLGAFGPPELLNGLAAPAATSNDIAPFLTADGEELWFASDRAGGPFAFDIYRAPRVGSGFGNPVAVDELNTAAPEVVPILSADRLTVYFTTNRGGSTQGDDIWSSHRRSVADRFSPPAPVANVNTAKYDHPSWLSPDNCRLYITSDIAGTNDLYVATRHPR